MIKYTGNINFEKIYSTYTEYEYNLLTDEHTMLLLENKNDVSCFPIYLQESKDYYLDKIGEKCTIEYEDIHNYKLIWEI